MTQSVQKSQRFFERIFEIPMISSSYDKATNFYTTAKASNAFAESTLNLMENFTKSALETTQPIRQALDGPIVYANKVACEQLNKLEEKYPDVKLAPNEIVDRSKAYYETSSLKNRVDQTVAIKNQAVEKGKDVQQSVLTFVNDSLKFSEALVKARLGTPNSDSGPSTSTENVSYFNRFRNLTTTVSEGLLYRFNKGKENFETKEKMAKEIVSNLRQNLSIDFNVLKTRSQDVLTRARQTIVAYEANSENILLNLVHYSARTTISISDKFVNFSKPYFNESTEKVLTNFANYIRTVNQNFTETKSLKEVKDKSVEQAKSGFEYLRSYLTHLTTFMQTKNELNMKKLQ